MEYSLCVGLLFHLLAFPVLCTAQSGDWIDGESHIQKQTTFACQYSILELECPSHYVIRISRANYGRFSTWLCNPSGVTENLDIRCHSITAVEVISSKCDGHNKCQIPVNNDEFDDPCPGTSKYIEVQHYCEPAKSDENNSGLKPLPDGNRPHSATVPTPENVQACLHPMARGSVYDLYWEVPETHLTILHFNIMYRVNGVIRNKDVMQATQLEGRKYVYAFKPDENQQSFDHEFAVKAYFLNIGWGDYSPFTPSKHCHLDEDGNHVTLYPIEAATTTTDKPKDGGGLRQMCSPVNVYGVHWPATAPGEVRTSICPPFLGGKGVMHYKCLSGGVWDRNGPETDDCSRVEYSTTKSTTTTTSSTTTTMTTSPITTSSKEDVSKPVSFNDKVTKLLQSLEPAGEGKKDKYNLVTFLPNITQNWTQEIQKTKDPKKKKAMADNYKESLLALSEEVLNDDNAWNNMSTTQQRQTAASILGSVEQSGLMAASTMAVGTSNITRKTNVVVKVMNVDTGSGRAATMDDQSVTGSRAKGNWFTIPSGVLVQAATNSGAAVPVVFVVMSDISEWMTPKTSPRPTNDNVIDARPEEEPKHRLVNTDVVSVSVSTRPMKHLMEPVVFLLEHRQTESVEKAQCSFWDTEKSRWSTEGCKLVESNKTHTVCKCYHLTSFAVLMDITGTTLQLSDGQRFSLELITYIGCTISIICLLLSWVTFTCFKNLDCDRNTIHKHLVFCLMVAQIVLVTGLQQTQPPLLCSIIAGVLHFFFLASFAWMCLEGVQLYVMLIEVFESEHSRVLYYYLFGYGVPAIIVAVSAAVYSGGYGTEFHCWLTVERGFIWSFVGPVLAVLLVNVVMLGIAISIMVRHSTMSHTMRQKSVPQKMRSWVKGAVVLVVLLGLTWVFGVLYLDNVYHTLIFSYIFTILNTLQGLFIFLFHCLMNEKVQKEYRRLVRRCQCLPNCLRARYGYTTSTGSRDNTSSGNVMARLFRGKRRHSGCGDSSSNSAKPFLHKEQRYLSSSVPSSSDGVVTSHLSSENSNNNNRKLSQHSASHSNASDSRFLRPVEMSGIAGELSEILDCSVVDSEFVSEYCQQNMQVSSEVKRYSTSSEDSGGGDELDEESEADVGERLDRLPASSVESLSRRHSHVISTSDLGQGEKKSEGGEESDGGVEGGVVTALACVNVAGGQEKEEEEGSGLEGEEDSIPGSTSPETQPLMIKQTDSEQVLILNAVNKPRETRPAKLSPKQSPSLTFIPSSSSQEANRSSPVHTSVPCLKFKPGTTSPPPDVADAEQDSVVISLPDLSHEHQNGTAKKPHQLDLSEDSASAKRHSSGGRMQFSPFRFSGSDC